ncbi:MAG: F0F1 ATP synthase subunit delta [Candidatus Dormibacteria bacterium]
MSDVLARRYARAFFELARDAGEVEGWGDHLAAAQAALADPQVAATLSNPRVSTAQRVEITQEVGRITSAPTANLLRLLVERGRVGLLPGIVTAYRSLADADSGVVRAGVTTALPVDAALRSAINKALAERLGTDVEIEVTQDGAILGGLVIRIGDRVIDNSVRTHLQQLQAALA